MSVKRDAAAVSLVKRGGTDPSGERPDEPYLWRLFLFLLQRKADPMKQNPPGDDAGD